MVPRGTPPPPSGVLDDAGRMSVARSERALAKRRALSHNSYKAFSPIHTQNFGKTPTTTGCNAAHDDLAARANVGGVLSHVMDYLRRTRTGKKHTHS